MNWLTKFFRYVSALFRNKKVEQKILGKVILPIRNSSGRYIFFCPGCQDNHMFNTLPENNIPCHTLTGTLEKPTIRASILSPQDKKNGKPRCHSFITDGRIAFLNDCSHRLAGQTVDLEPI